MPFRGGAWLLKSGSKSSAGAGQRLTTSYPRASEERAPPWDSSKIDPQAPTGRNKHRADSGGSVPNVTLVDLHAVLATQRAKLVLKRHLAMMLFLRRDIIANLFDIRLANGERAVSALPVKVPVTWSLFLHPFRRTLLRFFHKPRDGDSAGQIAQDVNVILDAVDEDGFASDVLHHARHVSVQAGAEFRVFEKWNAVLRAEDDM